MKRRMLFAGIVVLALLSGGASVWEGNAVVGGAGDFSSEGFLGACNSFPRDTPVEVSNLENGRTITVVISRNVDNPGVFIALSPKAAEALGMKPGSAARVRAVSKAVSSAQASLPAARPGENSDPDFNPRALVERGKTAAAGAGIPGAPAVAAAPSAAAIIDAAAAGSAPVGASASTAEAGSETAVEPAVTAVEPAATETGTAEATAEAKPKLPADETPLPPTTPTAAGEARPGPFALSLPTPDQVPPGQEALAPSAKAFPASGPEELGGSIPQPRKTGPGRVALAEPGVPALAPGAAEGIERPQLAQPGTRIELLEPGLGPDTLPEDALPRLAAPESGAPKAELAEIDVGATPPEATVEALDLEKPAVAGSPGAPAQLSEPPVEGLVESPEASSLERPAQVESPPSIALAEPTPASPEPVNAPGELSIALEPAAPRPPVGGPTVAAVGPGAKSAERAVLNPKTVPLVPALSKGSFYVQVGVYVTNEAIEKAAGGFAAGYPLAMEKVEMKTGSAYRLYVGPLSRDESGVVLYRIKSLGYKDAFVRIGT